MLPVDTTSSRSRLVITAAISGTERSNVVTGRTQKPFRAEQRLDDKGTRKVATIKKKRKTE